MKTNLLSSDKDPMGTAIADYFNHNKADKLRVFSSQFEEDEIPVNQLFRPYDEMPELEQIALQQATGKILDVGAGTGTDCLTNGRRKYSGRRSRKRLPCTGLARDGKRGMRHRHFPPFCRSNGKKRGKECPSDESFRSAFSRNIRYNPHADERIGHYREVGKYGSFLSKDETTASPRGMYLDGFQ